MRLEVEALVHCYASGVRAVDGVTLAVAPGSRVALLGSNGAGKSTLARHCNGLLHPSSGAVRVGGTDIRTLRVPERAARVGFMFQSPDDQLLGRPIRDEVAFGPRQVGVRGAALQRRVDAALDAVGLDPVGHPLDLDYGGRKLLALACVLAMQTPILVLDEPTAHLDWAAVQRVTAALAARPQATVIAISHDLDWAVETFDRFLVMAAGRLVADGPASAMSWAGLQVPSIPYLAAGLGMPSEVVRYQTFMDRFFPTAAPQGDRY